MNKRISKLLSYEAQRHEAVTGSCDDNNIFMIWQRNRLGTGGFTECISHELQRRHKVMVVHTCNLSMKETEAQGSLQVCGKSRLHRKTLSREREKVGFRVQDRWLKS